MIIAILIKYSKILQKIKLIYLKIQDTILIQCFTYEFFLNLSRKTLNWFLY